MGTLPGHEKHWHCQHCGRPICPDCTDNGDTCGPVDCPEGWGLAPVMVDA
jgi:hypothetical protein